METTGITGIILSTRIGVKGHRSSALLALLAILVSWQRGIVTFHDDLPNFKFGYKASSRWLLSPKGLQVLRGLLGLHDGFSLYHHFGVVGKPLEGHSR